jgi:hypothetical protein
MRRLLAAGLFLLPGPALALPGVMMTARFDCPIGGQRFELRYPSGHTIMGQRPDGLPIGSMAFPVALPECPGNGLILYKRFDAAELARLETLIASEPYRALRREDAQYYRYHWLLREMGAPALEQVQALGKAVWQAEAGTPRRQRYLRALIEASAALPGEPADLPGFAIRGQWINALRELGRFEEAAALLAQTDIAPLQVDDPDDERERWRRHYATMATLIGRRDAAVAPLDVLPLHEANRICHERRSTLGAGERAYCDGEIPRRLAAELRRMERQMDDLLGSLETKDD